jgi:large subunit ribosomal protein L15
MELKLESLSPNVGSKKRRRRLGRGPGSGLGKTSGKGHKGQKARSGGKVARHFEGGQMPLYRRIPKIGFTSLDQISGKNSYTVVGLDILNRFNDGDVVDRSTLAEHGLIQPRSGKGSAGLKLLANGVLEKKLTVKVNKASVTAQDIVIKAGGAVELI